MVGIPARSVTTAKKTINDVQGKRFVRSVPVTFKPGPQRTVEEACTVVNVADGSPSGSRCLSYAVPVIKG